MKKLSSVLAIVLAVILALGGPTTSFAGSRNDHTQFTANLEWCYQTQTRVEVSASDAVELYAAVTGDAESAARMRDLISYLPIPAANAATVPREWYVRVIRAAAATRDAEALKRIYRACQQHNETAIEYLEGESPINMVRAARYIVACKGTSPGGSAPDFCSQLLAADQQDCNEHGCGYDIAWPLDLY